MNVDIVILTAGRSIQTLHPPIIHNLRRGQHPEACLRSLLYGVEWTHYVMQASAEFDVLHGDGLIIELISYS